MRFEVKTDLDKKDFLAFFRLNQKAHARFAWLIGSIGRIASIVLAVILVIMIAAFRLWEEADVMRPFCILVVLLIAWPLVNRFLVSQLYKANGSMLRGEYRFGEDEAEVEMNHMSGKYAYSAFSELYHSGGVYYLYIDKGHSLILPERCFTQGDPAAFGAFISEKTGLEVKEIK